MYFFFRFFKNEENLKKNTSTSGCIEKYISLVKMYKKIRNRKIELKKKIIPYIYSKFNNFYIYALRNFELFEDEDTIPDKDTIRHRRSRRKSSISLDENFLSHVTDESLLHS